MLVFRQYILLHSCCATTMTAPFPSNPSSLLCTWVTLETYSAPKYVLKSFHIQERNSDEILSNEKHVLKCLPESSCSAEFVLKCQTHVRQSQDLPQHSCLQSLCHKKHCVPKGEKVFSGEQPRRKGAIRSKISFTSPATPLTSPNSRSRQRRTTKKEKNRFVFQEKNETFPQLPWFLQAMQLGAGCCLPGSS